MDADIGAKDGAESVALDVIERMDADNADASRYQLAPSAQRSPVGLFVVQVQRALTGVEPPVLRRQREASDRAAARTAAAAARAAETACLAALAVDPEVQARISAAKASIRETLAAVQRAQRLRGSAVRSATDDPLALARGEGLSR